VKRFRFPPATFDPKTTTPFPLADQVESNGFVGDRWACVEHYRQRMLPLLLAVLVPTPCPATELWDAFSRDVPIQDETRNIRAQVAYGVNLAEQATREPEPLAAARRCLESVEAYEPAVKEFYYGAPEQAALMARAHELATSLERQIDLLAAAVGPPAPEPPDRRYKRRAMGLLISGGLVAVPTLLLRLTASVSDHRQAQEPQQLCIESCFVGTALNPASLPLQAATAGLIGGGMRAFGRWSVLQDVQAAAPGRVRARRLTWLGVGLMGAGLGTLVGTQAVSRSFEYGSPSAVATRDAGWWVAAVSVPVGAGFTGYGTGVNKQLRSQETMSVMPRVSPDWVGLSVSGRM